MCVFFFLSLFRNLTTSSFGKLWKMMKLREVFINSCAVCGKTFVRYIRTLSCEGFCGSTVPATTGVVAHTWWSIPSPSWYDKPLQLLDSQFLLILACFGCRFLQLQFRGCRFVPSRLLETIRHKWYLGI